MKNVRKLMLLSSIGIVGSVVVPTSFVVSCLFKEEPDEFKLEIYPEGYTGGRYCRLYKFENNPKIGEKEFVFKKDFFVILETKQNWERLQDDLCGHYRIKNFIQQVEVIEMKDFYKPTN